MPLRRFQPISRSGQWRDIIAPVDPRTGSGINLSAAVLTLTLTPLQQAGCFRDYGRIFPQGASLYAQTNDDNTGLFRKLASMQAAEFVFPQAMVAQLGSGTHLLIVTATIGDQTDEIERQNIVVLDQPAQASQAAALANQTPPKVVVVVKEF